MIRRQNLCHRQQRGAELQKNGRGKRGRWPTCIPPCIDGHTCRRCWSRLSNIGSLFYFYKKYTPDSCDTLVHSCTKICTDCYGLVDRRSRLQTREHTSTQNLAKKKCRNPITVNMAKLYKVQTSPDSYPTYSTTTITDKDTKILVEALKCRQLGMAP